MNSIRDGGKKQFPSDVQFLPAGQRFQQPSTQKSKKPGKESNRKTVHFNFRTSSAKQPAFQNVECNSSEAIRSGRSLFDSRDPVSSSANMFSTEVPIVDHEPICSARATVMTFIIVVLIVLTTAIAIGIVFGTMNSQQNSNSLGTQTGNNNTNSLLTVSTPVATSSVSVGSQSGPPCTSYTTINDPTRSSNQTGLYGTCDRGSLFNASSAGSWIRFVGTGGTTISATPPGLNPCGGFFGGWFNSTLPTTVGLVVNGTICFALASDSCGSAADIFVVNCGTFYVYLLPSVPACNMRYCTI